MMIGKRRTVKLSLLRQWKCHRHGDRGFLIPNNYKITY